MTATTTPPNVAPTTMGQTDLSAFDRAAGRASIFGGGRRAASDRKAGREVDGAARKRRPVRVDQRCNPQNRIPGGDRVGPTCGTYALSRATETGAQVAASREKCTKPHSAHSPSTSWTRTHGSKAHSTHCVRLRFVPWCGVVEVSQGEVLLHLRVTNSFDSKPRSVATPLARRRCRSQG